MSHLNIESISLSSRDRLKEDRQRNMRKKTIAVLIYDYLRNNGFIDSADSLKNEAKFDIVEFTTCDNVDLDTILKDYESYYFLKYQRLPNLVKKLPTEQVSRLPARTSRSRRDVQSAREPRNLDTTVNKTQTPDTKVPDIDLGLKITGLQTTDTESTHSDTKVTTSSEDFDNKLGDMYIEPFGNASPEWKSMADVILADLVQSRRQVWSDIVGLERTQDVLKETVVYPIKYRDLLSVSGWKSVLLFGPSGTGKTLLATTAAAQSGAAFFRISTSTLISKWRGESEKLVRVLFDVAKHYAPAVIFLDEIDAILGQRGNDHEASRRMKTEFFLQMDNLEQDGGRLVKQDGGQVLVQDGTCVYGRRVDGRQVSVQDGTCFLKQDGRSVVKQDGRQVVVIGATNMPWDLDHASLRRMEKRIYVPLPDFDGRVALFRKFLEEDGGKFLVKYDGGVKMKNGGGSGDWMSLERNKDCVRKISATNDFGFGVRKKKVAEENSKEMRHKEISEDNKNSTDLDYSKLASMTEHYSASDIKVACKEAKMSGVRELFRCLEQNPQDIILKGNSVNSVTMDDILAAIGRTKPAASQFIDKYECWRDSHGSE